MTIAPLLACISPALYRPSLETGRTEEGKTKPGFQPALSREAVDEAAALAAGVYTVRRPIEEEEEEEELETDELTALFGINRPTDMPRGVSSMSDANTN